MDPTRASTDLSVFEGPDTSGRSIVRLDLEGPRRGPHVWMTACVHGDEVTGIEVVLRLMASLRSVPFAGRVSAIPVVNPTGLVRSRREAGWAHDDINRLFPGKATGGTGERLARAVYSAIASDAPDVALDLHADSVSSLPYVILDRPIRPRARRAYTRARDLATRTGLWVVDDWPARLYRRLRLDRSLSGSILNAAGLPSMTIELGPTRLVEPAWVAFGFHAVALILERLGMAPALDLVQAAGIPARPAVAPPPGRLRRLPGPTTRSAGLLRMSVAPGDRVGRGQPLAQVLGFDGTLIEEVTSPAPGWILSLPERIFAWPGVQVATLAVGAGSATTRRS